MKKKILFTLCILMGALLLYAGASHAATYSGPNNTLYEIKLSEYDFNVTLSGTDLEAESKDGRKYVGVAVTEEAAGYPYTEEMKNFMVNYFKQEFGSDFHLISSRLIESNGCKGMEMKFGSTISYQYIYVDLYAFNSDYYSYQLLFMSLDRSFLYSTEKDQIFNSFKIKDMVMSSNGIPFTDVPSNSWYHGAVKYVYDNNIIKGTNAYTFAPNEKLTRGMLVTILHRMEGEPYVGGTSKFSDVQNPDDYYYVAVKWATQNNIVSGYNDGRFGPNDNITREQLAVILNKYCRYKGKYKPQANILSSFHDANKISSFATWEMQWATGAGVITGSNGTLNPQGTTTRAEAASMLYKYCLNIK